MPGPPPLDMKQEPAYYAIIPATVRYDPELSPNSKLLYGEITALTKATGICWAGNEYFAELYGVNSNTISKWVSKLNLKGYIYVEIKMEKGKQHEREIRLSQKGETPPTKRERPLSEKGEHNSTVNNTDETTSNEVETPAEYGDPKINTLVAFFEEQIGGPLDESVKQNRQHCKMILTKMKKWRPDEDPVETSRALIIASRKSQFHAKNATSFRYLYYNAQKIVHEYRQHTSKPGSDAAAEALQLLSARN